MVVATRLTGFAIAATAASLFVTAPLAAAEDATTIVGRCTGVNSCKGQSSCRSDKNTCKGQNACKGTGFVELTKQQCDQVGGQFQAAR
jgi:hypothetical protein